MLDYDYLARPVQARAAHARGDADGAGRRRDLYVPLRRRASSSRRTRRSRASRASSPPPITPTASSACSIPRSRVPWLWLVDGKIVGADEAWAKAAKSGPLRLRRADRRPRGRRPLHAADPPRSSPTCAFSTRSRCRTRRAVAREVVEAYGLDFGAHPVGTGPVHARRVQAQREDRARRQSGLPRDDVRAGGPDAARSRSRSRRRSRARGCRSPGASRSRVIEEGQAQWLAFLNREVDLLERLPSEFVDEALVDGKLKPELAAKGIRHEMLLRPNTWWTYFNMDDPVVGGYTPEKIALRRAIGMALRRRRKRSACC